MAELTELSSDRHSDWKVATDSAIKVAAQQHILSLKVTEVNKAISNFPVFLTKMSDSGDWAISAITCLEVNKNLFINDGKWEATYLPTGLQTYPFFLMQSPEDKKKFTIGIEEANPAFSTEVGEPLFEEEKKASILLSTVTAMLEDDLKNEVHTYQFSKMLSEQELLTPIDIVVQYENGRNHSLKGLYTIDEAKLQALSAEDFQSLREKGYLAPIYGLLMSIYQLNGLIARHNLVEGVERIDQIKIETQKPSELAS